MKKVILFGGTFDPPHLGHQHCLLAAQARIPSSEVVVLPTVSPPPLAGSYKEPLLSFGDRVAACEGLFGPLPQVSVSRLEAELPQPNFTYQLVKAWKERHPDTRCYLLIGEDHLGTFHLWNNASGILSMVSLVVVARCAHQNDFEKSVQTFADHNQVTLESVGDWTWRLTPLGTEVIGCPVESVLISSSEIRKHLRQGKPISENWIPEPTRSLVHKLSSDLYKGKNCEPD